MHILIIPSWYPSEDNQVRGSFFKEQAEALQKSGNNVGVIYPEARILRFGKLYGFKNLGIKQYSINKIVTIRSVFFGKIPGRSYWRERRLWTNDALRLFKVYTKANGLPDIVHVHSALNGGLVAVRIKKKYGIHFVLTEHSTGYSRNLFTKRDQSRLREIFTECDYRIVVSPGLGNDINNFLNSSFDFKFIPNIVHNKFFSQKIRLDKVKSEFLFLSVGNLTERKGHYDLITAFGKAFRNNPNVILKIIGSGELYNKLKTLIYELKMEKQIFLIGKVERGEIVNEYYKADCFVLASHYETFGVVLIEAMAVGLPVISTSCGGPEYIVNSNNGVLVPVGDIKQLKKEMLYMYGNKKKYNPDLIRKECIEKFSERKIVNTLLPEYRRILESNFER